MPYSCNFIINIRCSIDFKIKNSVIILTTALLQITTNIIPQPKKTHSKRQLTGSSKSFYSRRQNQHYEILEQNTVECKPKKIRNIKHTNSKRIFNSTRMQRKKYRFAKPQYVE